MTMKRVERAARGSVGRVFTKIRMRAAVLGVAGLMTAVSGFAQGQDVITSYSIHYTKLYELPAVPARRPTLSVQRAAGA